jgi:hypothetical protein
VNSIVEMHVASGWMGFVLHGLVKVLSIIQPLIRTENALSAE